jgi:transposase
MQLEHEQDIDILRQKAILLEKENQRLHTRLRLLVEELNTLKGQDAGRLQLEIELLQQALAGQRQALFGDSSEKRPRAGGETPIPVLPAPRQGHGPKIQPRLPISEAIYDLPEAERQCPVCGKLVSEMGGQFEESEEISVVQRHFVLVRHRRKKYRCRCNSVVLTAPAPPKLQPGGHYSPEFAVEVAVAKYADHAPLERQRRIMEREGLEVESQTLWDQLDVLARLLEPSYRALRPTTFVSPLVHADETYWRLMGKEKERSRWWTWAVASPDAVFYQILETRSKEGARSVLSGYEGLVMADGYGAYQALQKDGGQFTLVHCWAHVRRKVVQAEPFFPRECAQARELIGKLYDIERSVPRAGPEATVEEVAARHELLGRLRREQSREIVEKIRSWAYETPHLPRSALGKAVHYLLQLWPGLVAFLDDPRIPLDNNAVERGIRGVVLGRKNHYGSRSRRGTEVAALFYSLVETCKLRGVEPRGYLLQAVRAALAEPGAVTLPERPSI